ncbi:thermonuclease family protein [Brachyspira catarrhinii]|uniref:Thermonuclease family protein n=1 Tax=Brachyspira catarrhinii TaxID=2528966 RepID=A0ABY2TQA2_9SPIR|nr:thermonuclease family protein [Brachyspira catarrhinii]TKZ33138.1 thermonuclease family protein [Brachyspira catarrhinii]
MTKNIKTVIIIFLIFSIFFITIIKNKNIHLNNSKNLFIDSNSLLSLIENNKVSIVYDYLKYRDKVYCININDKQNKEDKNFIKNRFPSIKFINKFQFYFYSKFFKEKIMFYINYCDKKLIEYLKKKNIKYCKVVLNINEITAKEYLNLRDKDNARIFLSITNKDYYDSYKYSVVLNKKYITVLDGDTIKYKNQRYRFIGLDAPELKQNYGEQAKNFVINSINNASKVSILISSYDLYDRILCHIIIDGEPFAYSMIKEKYAKETIIKYGDSGFPIIASNIVYLSKFQGRRPFIDPAVFRRTNN